MINKENKLQQKGFRFDSGPETIGVDIAGVSPSVGVGSLCVPVIT